MGVRENASRKQEPEGCSPLRFDKATFYLERAFSPMCHSSTPRGTATRNYDPTSSSVGTGIDHSLSYPRGYTGQCLFHSICLLFYMCFIFIARAAGIAAMVLVISCN